MLKQREIVLITVPYADLSASKRRPVLILSSDQHLRQSQDMLVATITSNLNAGTLRVIFDTSDMEVGYVQVKSLIRADKIHNLSQSEVIKSFGVLNKAAFDNVLTELDNVLGR